MYIVQSNISYPLIPVQWTNHIDKSAWHIHTDKNFYKDKVYIQADRQFSFEDVTLKIWDVISHKKRPIHTLWELETGKQASKNWIYITYTKK